MTFLTVVHILITRRTAPTKTFRIDTQKLVISFLVTCALNLLGNEVVVQCCSSSSAAGRLDLLSFFVNKICETHEMNHIPLI